MKTIRAASALGASAFASSGSGAAAAIVCSDFDCWHTTEAYEYPAEADVIVHPDDRRWAEGERDRWREHAGRGFLARRRKARLLIATTR